MIDKNQLSRKQFRTLLLIYAANADMEEKKVEIEYIREIAQCDHFDEIHQLYDECNDYECIQLILSYRDRYFQTTEDCEQLLSEVAELFRQDGHFDIMEANMFRMLRKLIR